MSISLVVEAVKGTVKKSVGWTLAHTVLNL